VCSLPNETNLTPTPSPLAGTRRRHPTPGSPARCARENFFRAMKAGLVSRDFSHAINGARCRAVSVTHDVDEKRSGDRIEFAKYARSAPICRLGNVAGMTLAFTAGASLLY
jgi:hypothetical protein